jgi:hypothetical protein
LLPVKQLLEQLVAQEVLVPQELQLQVLEQLGWVLLVRQPRGLLLEQELLQGQQQRWLQLGQW